MIWLLRAAPHVARHYAVPLVSVVAAVRLGPYALTATRPPSAPGASARIFSIAVNARGRSGVWPAEAPASCAGTCVARPHGRLLVAPASAPARMCLENPTPR